MPISEYSAVLIAALLAAHLCGDLVFQTSSMVEGKRQLRLVSYVLHTLLHAMLAYVLAGYWTVWLLPVVILLTHFVIDYAKEITNKTIAPLLNEEESVKWKMGIFTIDQLLHVAVILALPILLLPQQTDGFWTATIGELWPIILVLACGATICINMGGFVIGILIQPFLSAMQNHEQEDRQAGTIDVPPPRGFPNGGRVIGQLERLLIFVLVLNAQYTAVGFLVAAKSIFRFGELNNPAARMESEYIIIGTMMSFAWAIVASWATAYVLRIVVG